MNKKRILEQVEKFVKDKLYGEGSGHDWWHAYRVLKTANYIAKNEEADLFVVQLAALLHDISDWKFNKGDDNIGPKIARDLLEKMKVEEHIILHVSEIIKDISFKGAGVKTKMRTKEGMIVQDADRLDALGAIGIARTFAYGGYTNREIYNPNIKPQFYKSFDKYKKNTSPTINHFYEKLLLLKDLMNTKTARKIAERRHKYMEKYLEHFFKEWNGNF
jgi:uncharacterized protein